MQQKRVYLFVTVWLALPPCGFESELRPDPRCLAPPPFIPCRYLTFCSYTLQTVQWLVCCLAHVSRVSLSTQLPGAACQRCWICCGG